MIVRSISENKNGLVEQNIAAIIKQTGSISESMQFEEIILDYEYEINGLLANVWEPYSFYINGKLQHSGVNAFQLFKDNGVWKIINLIDSRKKPS